jgi:two-component system cell cycle response regulator DivK
MAARILYIEDNHDNFNLIKRIMEAEGYVVLEATDGPSGIRMAQEAQPNLILMDINLPEIDGYTATTALRKIPGLEHVPIVAVTANVMKGDREKTLAAGCDGYIQKPIDADRLPEQIASFLKPGRQARG